MYFTQEEINKFNNDVETKSRWLRIAISFDQFVGCLIYNKSQDETISSYIKRKIDNGTATWFDKSLCWCLRKIESEHCLKSLGE